MADVDICNRALGAIGARATISSLNDPVQAAIQCKLNYAAMRKMLLRSAHWGFARRQVALAQIGSLSAGTAPYPWLYEYSYPSDCLKVRYLVEPSPVPPSSLPTTGETLLPYTSSRQWRFLIGNDLDSGGNARRMVLTNLFQAFAVYTVDVTNTDLFDDSFTEALVAGLASKLVIPLTGNVAMRQSFINEATSAVINARVADGNEALPSTSHTPDWIQARGIPDYYAYGGGPGILFSTYDTLSWGE